MSEETLLDLGKRIKAIADIGLLYSKDHFDRGRYHELKEIGETIIQNELNVSPDVMETLYAACVDYPTPKVDVRALVLNDQKEILMVQEKSDSRWSLPGGWADIGKTPSEIAIQEVREETGLLVSCKCLSGVFDKRKHAHPPQPWYVYKLVFYCEAEPSDMVLQPAFDVLDVAWFAIDALPPLSTDRILASQIEVIYANIRNGNFMTLFD